MKHKRILNSSILALALLSAMPCAFAQSDVPNSMSYQGRISDQTGALVGSPTPVNRTVIFRVWNSASATAPANLLYSEQQIVTIASGEFNVLVGQGLQVGTEPKPAFDTVFNGAERFLGVTVDNGDGNLANDPEITPRQQLVTSAFAFRARTAEQVPDSAITSTMLAAGAVTANSIAANAIDSTKLAAGAVLPNIAANSIDSSKLATGAVTTASIAANAIDSSKLAAGAVTTASIAAGAIDSSKLAAGAVTTAAIAANAIDSTKLAAGAVTTAAIANNAINTSKIADGSVFEADLSNGSVTAAKLGPGIGVWGDPGNGNVHRASGQVTIGGTGSYGYQLNVIGSSYVTNVSWSTHFYNISDARMKSITARSNPHSDLELIRKLQVTDYRMIDEKMHGDGVQRGFIAQEVQKLVPEAVKKMQKHPIPSINAPATKATFDPGTRTLRIVLEKEHGLKKGDTVQLRDNKRSWEVNVTEMIDATSFVAGPVDAPISELFVYGKVVDDLLTVEYNRLFTTGIGAIQDLAKQVDAIKAENAELRTKLAASEQRFEKMEAADKSRDARLAAIEKTLRTNGGIVVTAEADHKQTEN